MDVEETSANLVGELKRPDQDRGQASNDVNEQPWAVWPEASEALWGWIDEIMKWVADYAASLHAKSRLVTGFLEGRMPAVCAAWLTITLGLSLFRLSVPASPIHNLADAAPILLAYSLIAIAPIVGYIVGRHAFAEPAATLQPTFRFALIGRWRKLSHADARTRPIFGRIIWSILELNPPPIMSQSRRSVLAPELAKDMPSAIDSVVLPSPGDGLVTA